MIAEEVEPRPSRALVAMPPRPVEPAGLRIGTVFYLLSVGLIAAATLGASMGIGFYLLLHPPQEAAAEPARSSDAELVQEFTFPTSEASAPIPNAQVTANALPMRSASPPEPESLSGEAAVRDIAAGTNPSPVEGEPGDQNHNASPQERVGEPSEVINGTVTDVRDVTTWVVGGRTIRLFGINPGPPKLFASLVNWVRAKGPVECLLQAGSLSYRCFTATGEDIAEAALLAGITRAGERAPAAYQSAEASARRMGKGLWAHR